MAGSGKCKSAKTIVQELDTDIPNLGSQRVGCRSPPLSSSHQSPSNPRQAKDGQPSYH